MYRGFSFSRLLKPDPKRDEEANERRDKQRKTFQTLEDEIGGGGDCSSSSSIAAFSPSSSLCRRKCREKGDLLPPDAEQPTKEQTLRANEASEKIMINGGNS